MHISLSSDWRLSWSGEGHLSPVFILSAIVRVPLMAPECREEIRGVTVYTDLSQAFDKVRLDALCR